MTPDLSPALILELVDLATDISREAGEEILALRSAGVTVAGSKSSAVDVVTEADRSAEEMIVAAIAAARPGDGIFAEEGNTAESTTGITWVIDPIDGTVNYVYGIPAFCVSIAATVADPQAYGDGRRAIAAAVFNPSTNEMFSAAEGFGAHLNGEPIHPSHETQLEQSLIATGFGYTRERRALQGRILSVLIPHFRDIRRIGSAAYDLCMVACGRIEAYYEIGIQPWDWAGGALVATEAGAITLGAHADQPAGTPLFIAGPPELATQLQTLLYPLTREG